MYNGRLCHVVRNKLIMFKQFIMKFLNLSQGGANLPKFSVWILSLLHGYNHEKYWRRRAKVVDCNSKTSFVFKLYYFLWLKRVDGKQHCSFGTNINKGAKFISPLSYLTALRELLLGMMLKLGEILLFFNRLR